MRVSKAPEVRRMELIGAAEELFREKGCEQTSVSDIVKKVGVAQGTFYYYFDSKDAVLDAVLDHYLKDHLEKAIRDIVEGPENARQRLQQVVDTTLRFQAEEKNMIEFLHADKNMVSHQKYMVKVRDTLMPLIARLLQEGIDEGRFKIPYPGETGELLLVMFTYLHDMMARAPGPDYERKLCAAEYIAALLLGLRDDSISMHIEG
jgi:AcrR family transcriptional regulator